MMIMKSFFDWILALLRADIQIMKLNEFTWTYMEKKTSSIPWGPTQDSATLDTRRQNGRQVFHAVHCLRIESSMPNEQPISFHTLMRNTFIIQIVMIIF